MRKGARILAGIMVMTLTLTVGITAYATEPQQSGESAEEAELTPEELRQKELDDVYQMPIQSNDIKSWPQGPGTYSEAAIVMEAGTGAILYAKNVDEHEYPASITKVLTTLVALEQGKLEDPVTFSHDSIAFLQAGDSAIGMKEGDQITLEQGLYATLLASANEAAYAVGESVGINAGHDYNWFLEQMNTRCKELGGENSNFVNTNGLHDPNHYTCARDMALIGRELFKYPEFFTIAQTLNYTIPASETCEEHVFQQHHKMMMPENRNYYEYVIGGKTGYTSDALSTLITMADNGDMQLICVVLRTHGANIYPDTRSLFEYVYSNFQKISVADMEDSKDIKEILEEDGTGYVVLPQDVQFSDLKMEIVPDGGKSRKATLQYSYEGTPVGMARADLSDSYIEEHSAKLKSVDDKDSNKKGESKWTIKKTILTICILGIVLLIGILLKRVIERNRRRKRRQMRQMQKRRQQQYRQQNKKRR